MSTHTIELGDGTGWFHGAISLQQHETGIQPWRINHDDLPLYEEALLTRAMDCAGVRLSLVTDGTELVVEADPVNELRALEPQATWAWDLLVDGQLHQREVVARESVTLTFSGWPAGEHRLELFLPHVSPVRVRRVTVSGGDARPFVDDRPRWSAYGSSITQCGAAEGPSETWPALVANRHGLNLLGLGYGGNCHMEPVVARMIASQPADYISLCLGINMQGASSYSPRTFRAGVIGTILAIRDRHPDTPMAVVSPIYSEPREVEAGRNAVAIDLPMMRAWIAEAVEIFRDRGDTNLHYVNGLDVMGADEGKHMPDQLHPDAEGYRVMAERYGAAVMPKLGVEPVAV